MVKILEPYISEGGHVAYHAQGNILLITENSANLRKLMELIELFDTDVFLNKRVQLYQIKHNRAKDLLPDLERVFATYAMSGKESAIKFIAIERLNGILAVAPNPSVASEVEKWITRLDQPVQTLGIRNFVYKIENSEAKKLEPILLRLYGHQAAVCLHRRAKGCPGVCNGSCPAGNRRRPSILRSILHRTEQRPGR